MKMTLVNRNRARAGTPAGIPLPIETPVLFECAGTRFWAQPAGRPPAAAVVAPPLLPADVPCGCRSVAGGGPPPLVSVRDDGSGRVDFFVNEEFAAFMARCRRFITAPIAVGFGVRTPQDAKRLAEHADGVIIGSKLVRLAAEAKDTDTAVAAVEQFLGNTLEAMGA